MAAPLKTPVDFRGELERRSPDIRAIGQRFTERLVTEAGQPGMPGQRLWWHAGAREDQFHAVCRQTNPPHTYPAGVRLEHADVLGGGALPAFREDLKTETVTTEPPESSCQRSAVFQPAAGARFRRQRLEAIRSLPGCPIRFAYVDGIHDIRMAIILAARAARGPTL